jgi:hypothetical protein
VHASGATSQDHGWAIIEVAQGGAGLGRLLGARDPAIPGQSTPPWASLLGSMSARRSTKSQVHPGLDREQSAVRDEVVDDGYGPVQHHWVIARKPRR